MNSAPLRVLSEADIEHFLNFGFVKVEGCFDLSPGSVPARWVAESWRRNGLDPADPAGWPHDKIHMPNTEWVSVRDFAPKAFDAMCDLCGGPERIAGEVKWTDGFIANYGWGRDKDWIAPGPDAPGWHKDGDFFRHFLDSPEQALLVVVLFSEVHPRGGATYLACDSVPRVARFLAEHPEGVLPGEFGFKSMVRECSDFREATGRPGDVYLLHPYILHASSYNHRPEARLMTNPVVSFQEPMQFSDPERCCPVERAILRGLGVERLEFRATAPRERVAPARLSRQAAMREQELERLRASSAQVHAG